MTNFAHAVKNKQIKKEKGCTAGNVVLWREDVRPSEMAMHAITVGSVLVVHSAMTDHEARIAFTVPTRTADI